MTGSECPPPAGFAAGFVSVHFEDTDAVIGATCQLRLTLPTRFKSYTEFRESLLAVLPEGKMSFTMI